MLCRVGRPGVVITVNGIIAHEALSLIIVVVRYHDKLSVELPSPATSGFCFFQKLLRLCPKIVPGIVGYVPRAHNDIALQLVNLSQPAFSRASE